MIAYIGQQQWLCTFFRCSDRTPISRVRDCCDLTGMSGIPSRSQTFGWSMDLTHFLAWRAGTNSRYSMGESPPIKAERQEPPPHLETTCSRFITSTRRRTCSSAGTGRSQQLEIPPSLNSKQAACFSSSASFSIDTGISSGAEISTPARILLSAWFSLVARILPSACFSSVARILPFASFLPAARILSSACFSLAASVCTYFSVPTVLIIFPHFY